MKNIGSYMNESSNQLASVNGPQVDMQTIESSFTTDKVRWEVVNVVATVETRVLTAIMVAVNNLVNLDWN